MDRDRIGQIYYRLGPMVYRRCLRLLADSESARDATQEVFVRAIRHAGDVSNEKEFLPWLYRIATNFCLNKLRDGKRLEFRRPEDVPDCEDDSSSEAWVANRRLVVALLNQVDRNTQQIAVFAFMDGMTQDEIAGVMRLSRRTIGKKLNHFCEMAQDLLRLERAS